MIKRTLKKFTSLLALCMLSVTAREFRTPTVFEFGYPYEHYPFDLPYDKCWSVNLWGAGFYRTAGRAFKDSNTTSKEDLSAIFFGKESFLGINVFPAGTTSPANPLLSIAVISPRVSYQESSAYFGVDVFHVFGCDCEWEVGLRANIPYKSIKMELDSCCDLTDIDNISALARQQDEVVEDSAGDLGIIQQSFAYRLDLLSALNMTVNPNSALLTSGPFVNYHNSNNNNRVTMANDTNDVTNGQDPIVINLVKRPDGTAPNAPFARRNSGTGAPTAVTSLPELPADGSGGSSEERFIFNAGTDYTPLSTNIANQAQLWVVPTVNGTVAASSFAIVPGSENIRTNFDRLASLVIDSTSGSVIGFFQQLGVTFDTQRVMGVGDLNTEFYVRRNWCNMFAEGIFGFFFPTGSRDKEPNRLLLVPTGNNRHLEIKLGGIFGWNPTDWFAMTIDMFYSQALKHKEYVAASFKGATVKNIGPTVPADISWGRFVANIDFTFSVPCIDPDLGFDLGYQAYVKLKDNVDFSLTMTNDFLGNLQPLDPSVIEERTSQVAHKAKVEFYYRPCDWQLYAGFQHVFAGKNVPNDTDWYLGFGYYF